MQISAGTYVVRRAVPAEDHSGVVAAQFGYSRRVSPIRIVAPALALLIVACARGDAPKSTATPPAQLPAVSAAAEAPPPPPPGVVAPQGSASAPALRDEAKADDKKTKGRDGDAIGRPAPTATATVQKPKCNCTPGDPTCNC